MLHKNFVYRYRQIVFVISSVFWVTLLVDLDWSYFGSDFRFFTYWSLVGCWISSYWALRLSTQKTQNDHHIGISIISIATLIMLFLYWNLYIIDPAMLYTDGVGSWGSKYIKHVTIPALQLIDAIFFLKVFRSLKSTIYGTITTITVYILWIELCIQPLNDKPAGSITSGLPYAFLNDMILIERLTYYGKIYLLTIILSFILYAFNRGLKRLHK